MKCPPKQMTMARLADDVSRLCKSVFIGYILPFTFGFFSLFFPFFAEYGRHIWRTIFFWGFWKTAGSGSLSFAVMGLLDGEHSLK